MFQFSDIVTLPVGIRLDGAVYRTVAIDGMRMIDSENMRNKQFKNAPSRATSMLLRRCIQSIEGLVPTKASKTDLVDPKWVNAMATADIDFLVFAIAGLTNDPIVHTDVVCPKCEHAHKAATDARECAVMDLPDDAPLEVELDLAIGVRNEKGEVCKKLIWRFPTGATTAAADNVPESRRFVSTVAACTREIVGFGPLDSEQAANLMQRDLQEIQNQLVDMTPGVEMLSTVVCPACGHEHVIGFDISSFLVGQRHSEKKASKSGATVKRRG